MTKFSTISLYMTKLYVTQNFDNIASSVTYSEIRQNFSNSVRADVKNIYGGCERVATEQLSFPPRGGNCHAMGLMNAMQYLYPLFNHTGTVYHFIIRDKTASLPYTIHM